MIFQPDRTHPFESLWSLWVKLVGWNHASARVIAGALRRAGQNPDDLPGQSEILEVLGLPGANIETRTPEALIDWLPAEISMGARLSRIGIRACPACLELGYHFPIFQILSYATCPQHGEQLIPLNTIAGAEGFPSNWMSIPAPRRAKWWPQGFITPSLGTQFPEIEAETKRLFLAKRSYQRIRNSSVSLLMADRPAGSFFEHQAPDDEHDAISSEAIQLIIDVYANWPELDKPRLGNRLHVSTVQVPMDENTWTALAAVQPTLGLGTGDEYIPNQIADESLAAHIRKHPEARSLESSLVACRRSFEDVFRSEHGPCFEQAVESGLEHVPCVHCKALELWRNMLKTQIYQHAFDNMVGRLLSFFLRIYPLRVSLALTRETTVLAGHVWSRAQYFAVLGKVRRLDTLDVARRFTETWGVAIQDLTGKAMFPPCIIDASKLPDAMRVHYLGLIHDQSIPVSDWDPLTRRRVAC